MKKAHAVVVVLAAVLLQTASLHAQENWTFTGQLRHRFEFSNKDFDSATDADNFNLLRSRFAAVYEGSENIEAVFQVQDSRLFGEELNTLTDGSAENLDLHQAYVIIKNLFDRPLDLKLGRMEAIYGNERLIGAVGWHNIGRSFDGFQLTARGDKANVKIFNFKEVESRLVSDGGDRNVFGVYGTVSFSETVSVQPYLVWQRMNPTDMLNRKTAGMYTSWSRGGYFQETEAAFQFGNSQGKETEAYMIAVSADYRFRRTVLSPVLSAGVDYLSGDADQSDNTVRVFDTLYATNHKFYGFMDYFVNIPAHSLGRGLRDIYVKAAAKPGGAASLAGAFHFFNAGENYMLTDGGVSTHFGNELDVNLTHRYDQHVAITAGVSFFFPGDIFREQRGGDHSTWFYLMTVVNLK